MSNLLFKTRICIFVFLGVIPFALAQVSYEKDSLRLEQLLEATKKTGTLDAAETKSLLSQAMGIADSLLNQHPTSLYYLDNKATLMGRQAFYLSKEGNVKESMSLYNEFIKIKKQLDKDEDLDIAYLSMAGMWHRYDKIEKVKTYYDSAWASNTRAMAKGKADLGLRAKLISHYGAHHANLGDFDKAEEYYKKALRYADSLKIKKRVAEISRDYAHIVHDLGRIDEAYVLRKKAYDIFHERDNEISKANICIDLAHSLLTKRDYVQAKFYIEKGLTFYKKEGMTDRLLRSYPMYTTILARMGNFEEAYKQQKIGQRLKDSIRSKDNYQKLADLDAELKYELERSIDSLRIVSERKVLEVEKEKKANNRFWIVVTLLLVILGCIAFFYFRNRQKIKEQAYQNILLNNKIANKTEEINELLTETIQHIKSKERIAENLQKLSSEKEGITLKSIIADLNASKADNTKLILIKQNIEQVNFEFLKKLKTTHPELTKTDIEICSFIRIGLSRKEVANLRNTSLEAVKSSRFRLKKKLMLSANDDLDVYINSL